MPLASFQLTEPLVNAMVALLSQNLNTTIDTLNAANADIYPVPHVVQFLPFVPIPSTLEAGMPAVGVQRLGAVFPEDLQFTTDAEHEYAVVAILQNADHLTLTWQLDRMMQAIGYTIQADRQAGTSQGSGGIMRTQGGAWSVNLDRLIPGPLLGDIDPTSLSGQPTNYVSWTALSMKSTRREVYG